MNTRERKFKALPYNPNDNHKRSLPKLPDDVRHEWYSYLDGVEKVMLKDSVEIHRLRLQVSKLENKLNKMRNEITKMKLNVDIHS